MTVSPVNGEGTKVEAPAGAATDRYNEGYAALAAEWARSSYACSQEPSLTRGVRRIPLLFEGRTLRDEPSDS
jgi:hypothetical protein